MYKMGLCHFKHDFLMKIKIKLYIICNVADEANNFGL